MTTDTQSFLNDFQELQTKFQTEAQEKLKQLFQSFWEKNPAVKSVTWEQYAPYFNDGEPCEFNVYSACLSNAESEEDIREFRYGEYNGGNENIWGLSLGYRRSYLTETVNRLMEKDTVSGLDYNSICDLSDLLSSSLMEPVLERMFGSDNRIIATRSGFVSEDFSGEHD